MPSNPLDSTVDPPRMVYAETDPDPALAPWLASYWTLAVRPDAGAVAHHVPPDGCTHLVFRAGKALLVGPRTEPLRPPVAGGDRWLGLRFRPGTARAFLGVQADLRLRDRVIPATEVAELVWAVELGRELGELGDLDAAARRAEQSLWRRRAEAGEPDAAVLAAVRQLLESDAGMTVRELARAVALSERQLRRRFVAAVDLTPKELARIWRFRRCAVELVAQPHGSWSDRAAEHGFADQSHLVREFQRLVGLPPRALERQVAAIEHANLIFPGPAGRS